jgi:hypothetical protein
MVAVIAVVVWNASTTMTKRFFSRASRLVGQQEQEEEPETGLSRSLAERRSDGK